MVADQHAAGRDKHRTRAIQTGVHDREDVVVNLHQTASSVLLRFTITNPATKTATPNPANTPMDGQRDSKVCGAVAGNMASKSASIPYVNGFTRMIHLIQPEAPATGNSAPESSHNGIKNRLMTAWNPCADSIFQAIANPNAVRANAVRKVMRATIRNCSTPILIPMNGATIKKSRP